MSYPYPSTPTSLGTERWVFHVKTWSSRKWDNATKFIANEKDDVYGGDLHIDFNRKDNELDLNFNYSDMASGQIIMTTARRGAAVLNATEKMRHGEGEYQISGDCKTDIRRFPRVSTQ